MSESYINSEINFYFIKSNFSRIVSRLCFGLLKNNLKLTNIFQNNSDFIRSIEIAINWSKLSELYTKDQNGDKWLYENIR